MVFVPQEEFGSSFGAIVNRGFIDEFGVKVCIRKYPPGFTADSIASKFDGKKLMESIRSYSLFLLGKNVSMAWQKILIFLWTIFDSPTSLISTASTSQPILAKNSLFCPTPHPISKALPFGSSLINLFKWLLTGGLTVIFVYRSSHFRFIPLP